MASGDHACVTFWSWVLTLFLWGSLVFFGIMIGEEFKEKALYIASIVCLSLFSVLYLIISFCSSTCSYLSNITNGGTIYQYMENIFRKPAFLVMYVQCYHYETRSYTTTDSEGRTEYHTETVRVNTHSAQERFHYISCMDCSGQFSLDDPKNKGKKKTFVKLKLSLDLKFAPDGTANDYEAQRAWFKSRNDKDTYQDYSERVILDGFQEYNLVNVGKSIPCSIGLGWYILFTFLTLVEFYKIYVDSFCSLQKFQVLKVVSSRGYLDEDDGFRELRQESPSILCDGRATQYNRCFERPDIAQPPSSSRGFPL